MLKFVNSCIHFIAIFSHLLNVLTGGKVYHSFSARVGYFAQLKKPWAVTTQGFIDKIFFWQDQHCLNEAKKYMTVLTFD